MERSRADASTSDEPRDQPLPGPWLTRAERIALGTIGLATLGAAAVSVFVATNELGSIGLVLFGGVATLCAVAGLVPLRFRMGGGELELTRARAEIVEVLQDPTRTNVDAATAAEVRGVLPPGDPLSSKFNLLLRQRAIIETAIDKLEGEFQILRGGSPGIDSILDFDGLQIGVQFEWALRPVGTGRTLQALAGISLSLNRHPLDGAILIDTSTNHRAIQEQVRDMALEAGIVIPVEVVGSPEAPGFIKRVTASLERIRIRAHGHSS